jgi:hypothetical protein
LPAQELRKNGKGKKNNKRGKRVESLKVAMYFILEMFDFSLLGCLGLVPLLVVVAKCK